MVLTSGFGGLSGAASGGTSGGVETKSIAYIRMEESWDLIDDLLSGTRGMRRLGSKWLPVEQKERPNEYRERLWERSYLYPGFNDAVDNAVSKPFSRAVSVRGEVPEQLEPIKMNADRQGRSFSQLARAVFRDAATYGLSHVLVDFPQNPQRRISSDPETQGSYPYFIHVPARSLFAWRTERDASGQEYPTQVRIRDTAVRADGEFGEKKVDIIRVYTPTDWSVFEKVGDNWTQTESGTHTFGSIPIVTFYSDRDGFMSACPPFEDLAWLNLAHWQSSSQQRNYLHFVRIGILFGSGLTKDQCEAGITIGPTRALLTENENAKLGYVEHGGAAIQAGERDLATLEAQMAVRALEPFMKQTGGETATGRAIDEAHTHAAIQEWIRSHEAGWERCWEIAAKWAGVELPEDFSVDIFNEFGLSMRAAQDVASLLSMRQAREISQRTFLAEVKRRGVLADSMDVDEEIEAVAAEGPALGTVGVEDEEDGEPSGGPPRPGARAA